MQDQFDAFEGLLVDTCPLVRATGMAVTPHFFSILQLPVRLPFVSIHATPAHHPTIAVEGVCRMANDYWELIPKETLAALFQHIVQDLSRCVGGDARPTSAHTLSPACSHTCAHLFPFPVSGTGATSASACLSSRAWPLCWTTTSPTAFCASCCQPCDS